MKVLLIGGAGGVGSSIVSYLRKEHEIRILDLRTPRDPALEFVQGSITDPHALQTALEGCDSFINLVMQDPGPDGGGSAEQDAGLIQAQYAVNTAGVHLLLFSAYQAGIRGGVHTSTMTVHNRARDWYWQEEGVPRDSPGVYGLTKGFGEQICEYFACNFDMNLIALRITGPRTRSAYLEARQARPADYRGRLYVTDEEDLARAYLAALEVVQVGHGRFDAVFIAGDEDETAHNLSKARRLLGWAPASQRLIG